MYRFHSLSVALLASIGIAIIPGRASWLFSAATLLVCVVVVAWCALSPRQTERATTALYGAVLVIAFVAFMVTLVNSTSKVLDPQAEMPVSVSLAPESVDAGTTVLDARATLVREGAPAGWRSLWFAVEILPFVAALGVILVLWPIARRPDEPLEVKNAGRLFAAGGILIVVPIILGIGDWALGRGAATALGVELGYGSEGTGLLNAGALGVGLVLLSLGYSVRLASELREFERSVI